MSDTPTSSPSLPELVRQVRKSREYKRLTDAIPYTRFMGIGVENLAGEMLCRMAFNPRNIGNSLLPALHGGGMSALAFHECTPCPNRP